MTRSSDVFLKDRAHRAPAGDQRQSAADLNRDWVERPPLDRQSAAISRPTTSSRCAVRCARSEPWPGAVPRTPMAAAPLRGLGPRPRRPDRRPGRGDGQRRVSRPSTCRAGRSPPTPTCPSRSTRTRASTRPTACRPWCAASTTPCGAPTRSSGASDGGRRRDWMVPIVADAEAGFGGALNAFELMKGDDRGRRGRRALGGPARLGEEVRPHGRQGPRPDRASTSAPWTPRGWPPTSAASRR